MSKLLRVLVFLGALALVLAVMALLGSHSGSRLARQRYEAQLRAGGEKLAFEELTRGRRPATADTYSIITNAAAKLNGGRLYPGMLEQRKYVRPGQAGVTWRQATPVWPQPSGPGSVGTWEEFAAQMQAAQGALRELREALKQPAADAGPATNMLLSRRVNFVSTRIAAQWLMGAAESDLHQGRLEAGLRNMEALVALAQMERDEYALLAQMIRVAVAGLGLMTTWEALQAPGWTEPQLARLQQAWEPVDLVEAAEKGLLGERAAGYEWFAQARHSSGPEIGRKLRATWYTGLGPSKAILGNAFTDHLLYPAYKITSIDTDELFYLETMQAGIAALRLVKAHRPWPEANRAVIKAGARLGQLAGALDRIRYFFSLLSIPNYTRAGEMAVQRETERQMTLAAIALKRYELRHGQLPPSLAALVPELLPAVPYDCMSGKPLIYRLKPDGSYLLYSAGMDGTDDGGDPTPPPGSPAGLWTGRDAVWPSPAAMPDQPPRQAE